MKDILGFMVGILISLALASEFPIFWVVAGGLIVVFLFRLLTNR